MIQRACPGLYYGPEPSTRTVSLEEIHEDCTVIVNCRPIEPEGRGHWYFPSKGEQLDERIHRTNKDEDEEEQRFIAFPIPNRGLPKQKDLLKVCKTIVECVQREQEVVYVHCRRDKETCGPVVALCMYWLKGEKDYDPIQELRKKMEFQICVTKDQRNLVKSCYDHVQQEWYWKGAGFQKKRKII